MTTEREHRALELARDELHEMMLAQKNHTTPRNPDLTAKAYEAIKAVLATPAPSEPPTSEIALAHSAYANIGIRVGDYVRHENGTIGRVERIEGAYVVLENDIHRVAARLLKTIEQPAPTESVGGALFAQEEADRVNDQLSNGCSPQQWYLRDLAARCYAAGLAAAPVTASLSEEQATGLLHSILQCWYEHDNTADFIGAFGTIVRRIECALLRQPAATKEGK